MIQLSKRHKAIQILLFLGGYLLLAGCNKNSTTFGARLYHRTTSYFNGYYNAELLFDETVAKLELAYPFPDNDFIEPIYYGTEDEISSLKKDFEKIMEKDDAVIFRHPHGSYVDESRLLNGKAWFYQKNYLRAQRNFQVVVDSFPHGKTTPEAWFWLAKTAYMDENPEFARALLAEHILEVDTLVLNKKLAGEIALFRVRLAIEDKDYRLAAALLEEQIENISPLQRRVRSHFLLGQLYGAANQYPKALEQYTAVVKSPSPYDIIFRAKLKIARLYVDFQEGKDDDQKVYEYLTALRKDPKNEDYLDQIFFEFALLEVKKDSLDEALGYLTKSVRANRNNQRQKTMSYFKAGQIYFYQLRNYPAAQAYYDSAATAANPKMPEYEEITNLAATLKDYVTHIQTIHYQDSMLYLAALPQDRLDAVVDSLVALDEKRKKEEEEAAKKALAAQQNSNFANPTLQNQLNSQTDNGSQGSWYFDNPSSVSSGKIQFQTTWKNRTNEDNWRRSKKSVFAAFAEKPAETDAAVVDSSLLNKYGDRAKYYQDIPKTPEEFASVNGKIEEAMYRLGQIYQLKLVEPDSAVSTYERELDRYPYGEFNLPARYALYQMYKEKGNPIAEALASYIINEHPQTVYAYLIQGLDPRELDRDREDFDFAYSGLFNAYQRKSYETSLGFAEYLLAQEKFIASEKIDLAEVQYIRGMSYGYLGVTDSLEGILTYVVNTWPQAGVTPIAQKTLQYLKNGVPKTIMAQGNPETPTPGITPGVVDAALTDPKNSKYEGFSTEVPVTDKVFVIMFVGKDGADKNFINTRLADFNSRLFKEGNLRVFTFMYQQTHLLPYISQFASAEDARKYITAFKKEPIAAEILSKEGDEVFYISHSNFKIAYGQKRMEDYLLFYRNILKQ